MLFYSFEFLYAFFPVVCLGFYALGRLPPDRHGLALLWLIAASLFFYGWWDPSFLLLITTSIACNYLAGRYLHRVKRRAVFIAAVAFNILLIAYFKYLGFFAGILAALTERDIQVGAIVLPLAISFFTFQQIAWLVDNYSRSVEEGRVGPVEYTLFVLFFPQLIAGPIVHHSEMIPQFRDGMLRRFQAENFTAGITIFIIGLFKKVVLADNLAPTANLIFDGAAFGQVFAIHDTWLGALAYTLQLYFDFSGYADMAIGLGLMFNIRLPVNFESPHKACSISEFWRRWHMTLSRFLRSYVYIPLGGNRKGEALTYVFLMITMVLGGLWHGAGWTYVIWGSLHGGFLVINQLWRKFSPWALSAPLAWLLTFTAVMIALVIFRSHDLDTAMRLLAVMFSTSGAVLPSAEISLLSLALIAAALAFVVGLPTTQQLLRHKYTPIEHDRNATSPDDIWCIGRLDSLQVEWSLPWLAYLAALAGLSVYTLLDTSKVQEFIYFQF